LGRDEERSLDCARDDKLNCWITPDNSLDEQNREATKRRS
jgi:hypothetical protein